MNNKLSLSVLLLMSYCVISNAQSPVWPFATKPNDNNPAFPVNSEIISWLDNVNSPINLQIPNGPKNKANGSAMGGYDCCGNMLFYVIHSGSTNDNELFVRSSNGDIILKDESGNSLGLNAVRSDSEIQVVRVPNKCDEWYIIYLKNDASIHTSGNSPNDYNSKNILFSHIKFDPIALEMKIVNNKLNSRIQGLGGVEYEYQHSKATTKDFLYCIRRQLKVNSSIGATSPIIDRFKITENGINYDISSNALSNVVYYNLTCPSSGLELNNNGTELAFLNYDQSVGKNNLYIFDVNASSISLNKTILTNQLIIKPNSAALPIGYLGTSTSYNITNPMFDSANEWLNVTQLSSGNFNLKFLSKFAQKLSDIQFSPNGDKIYLTAGGFVQGGVNNLTYLAQIDLNSYSPMNNSAETALLIQTTLGLTTGSLSIDGRGFSWSSTQDPNYYNSTPISRIESSVDGKLYFTKSQSNKLYVIPNPNSTWGSSSLYANEVDLSNPSAPNISTINDITFLPDHIDGFDYSPVNENIIIDGADSVCIGLPSVNLQALPSGGTWSGDFLISSQGEFIPNTEGTYNFLYTTSNGCFKNKTVKIIKCSQDTCSNVGIHLDGSNDYIELKSPYNGNQPITIEMWVQSQSTSTGACSNNSSANLDWILAFDDNNLGIVDCDGDLRVVFRPLCPSGNALCSSLPVRPIDDNKWHHIAISLSPATGFRVYIDGNRFTNFGHSNYDLNGTIRLGRSFGTGSTAGNHYKGKMDEVRFWDRVRTDAEILESFKCKLNSSEPNLLVYYDFEEGVAGGNNTARTFIDNVVSTSNAYDGSIKNLMLTDTISNYICVHHEHLPCGGENSCTPECSTSSVNIGTGVDYNDGSLLADGTFDGSWRLISGPDPVSYPKPVFILTRPSAWDDLVDSKYVSPYSNPDNQDEHPEPYVLERCFCVCKDNSKIKLDISSLVDNFLDLSLHTGDGTRLSTLLDYNGVSGNSTTDAFRIPAFENNLDTTLNQGKYCLRAGLRNDSQTYMGVSINATLTGAGLIENGCCDTFTYITGYVYNDKACNGILESGMDMGLPSSTIKLCNSSGQVVNTTISDAFGYYTFIDIPPGDYTIKQDSIPGRTRIQGNNGYSITLLQNTAIGNLDFGNCTNCCANSEKLTAAVNKGVRSIDIVDTLDKKITLRLPKLLSCQYVSKIFWGDGQVSVLNQGDPMPIHMYQQDGTYLISIEVTSQNLDRICQVDEVNFTVLFDCIATSVQDPDTTFFTISPNPTSDILNIKLNQNNLGYQLKVLDSNGKLILQDNISSSKLIHELNVKNLKNGVYILQLSNSQTTLVAKFVKI